MEKDLFGRWIKRWWTGSSKAGETRAAPVGPALSNEGGVGERRSVGPSVWHMHATIINNTSKIVWWWYTKFVACVATERLQIIPAALVHDGKESNHAWDHENMLHQVLDLMTASPLDDDGSRSANSATCKTTGQSVMVLRGFVIKQWLPRPSHHQRPLHVSSLPLKQREDAVITLGRTPPNTNAYQWCCTETTGIQ